MKFPSLVLTVAATAALTTACSRGDNAEAGQTSGGPVQLTGAGATFPYPIYSKWVLEYSRAHSAVQINYQSIGSGGGIRQFSDHTVDFGATDGPMSDSMIAAAQGNVLHIPTVLGAVVPIYNVPGITDTLRFTADVIAGIFLGQITRWNDSRIAAANPGVTLPTREVVVVHRSDGSGTSYVFTDYLSKVSPEWAQRVGRSTSVNWPTGLGGRGNEGVASTVSQTPGAVGYVELVYALQTRLAYGRIRNQAGTFVDATLASATAAAATAVAALPDSTDFRVSITDARGADAWPIASFTWILLPQAMTDAPKAGVLLEFLWWATHEGQAFATELGYAPLPARVVQLVEARLRGVTVNGQPAMATNRGP